MKKIILSIALFALFAFFAHAQRAPTVITNVFIAWPTNFADIVKENDVFIITATDGDWNKPQMLSVSNFMVQFSNEVNQVVDTSGGGGGGITNVIPNEGLYVSADGTQAGVSTNGIDTEMVKDATLGLADISPTFSNNFVAVSGDVMEGNLWFDNAQAVFHNLATVFPRLDNMVTIHENRNVPGGLVINAGTTGSGEHSFEIRTDEGLPWVFYVDNDGSVWADSYMYALNFEDYGTPVPYGVGWNGSKICPTRDVVYDKFEDLVNDFVDEGGDTMTGDLIVPTEAISSAWDGVNEVPTKDAVYDALQAYLLVDHARLYNQSSTINLTATLQNTWYKLAVFPSSFSGDATVIQADNSQDYFVLKENGFYLFMLNISFTSTANADWEFSLYSDDEGVDALTWARAHRDIGATAQEGNVSLFAYQLVTDAPDYYYAQFRCTSAAGKVLTSPASHFNAIKVGIPAQ